MRIILYTDNGLNGDPKRCVPPEHVNRTISGKRVFIYVVKDLEVRSFSVRVAPNPMTASLQETKEERPRHRRSHVKTEAEMGGIQPKAWDAWSPQNLDKAGRTLSWSLWRDFSPTTP